MIRPIGKRGISPVIATVLLVSIVLVLGLIIFMWARLTVKSGVEKFGETITTACDDVSLSVSYEDDGSLSITNTGSRVPVYNIQMRVDSGGGIEVIEYNTPINLAPSESKSLPDVPSDIVSISPILRGTENGQEVAYICDKREISV